MSERIIVTAFVSARSAEKLMRTPPKAAIS
jgi:hypothetical protein